MKSNIVLIGSGGVGTIAAYGLELGGKASVTAVVRSDYNVVVNKGYKIDSCDYGHVESFKPTNVVDSVEKAVEYGPFEYILVTTKNLPDIFKVEDLVAPLVSETSTIVLLQNGVDIGADVIKRYPKNVVLSGVSMISSTNHNGFIHHEGKDSLKIGYFINENLSIESQKNASERFVSIYSNGKNECTYDEDVKYTRWRKLVYNATLNSICTLTGVDVGRLELFGGVDSMVRSAMREVLAIAKSDGVDLPEDIMDFMIRSDDGIYYSPSMLVDLRKGNYIESEVICGNAVRTAKRNNVSCPNLELIYNLLCVIQMKTKEAKGLVTVPKERPIPQNGECS
ncbi:hypothetical protein PGUG_00020 [Meyerozyma guilliermondii ATCC 6260]|uniref:2-dehydropantoate 2-reductase n=1 Tax=Meyerozyma guilliermondii (strain ATCC 6260 / CBS 566 / DSM 6381 / JCM 1539 / NBRC 10279 / NRRL Y-324) TaxID=294746 RepID=A5D9R9_PICGU|nr:uncharacterized protein PGUG_00020 [Meyerozyma guilliermondii ATCC 6260]EDK35922.2 hypothetical protein PGUG_00020 [Meyerozyma guilliermondii ATCC 6260]